jgi:hypothetical protein
MMRAARASKIALAVWAVAAAFIEFYYVAPSLPAVRFLGPLALIASAIAAGFDRRLVAVVAAVPYIFPLLLYTATGTYHVFHTALWLGLVLGFLLPDAVRRPWSVPPLWAVALASWGGAVAIGASLGVLRSVDFNIELLTRSRLPFEALGGVTFHSISWIGHVSLLLVVGILWFDWLCGLGATFFHRWVLVPLSLSTLPVAVVAAYQIFVDVRFLNPTVFASLGRGAGTLFDANAAGTLGAIWIGGWAVLALKATGPATLGACLTGLMAMWLIVWVSGSKTAFVAAAAIAAVSLWQAMRVPVPRVRSAVIAAAVAGGVVAALLWTAGAGSGDVVGPIARLRQFIPDPSEDGLRWFGRQMWNRNEYGSAAARMIADYPLVGVGVGAFHDLVADYVPGGIPADNAQNWFRHQFAELGLLGSLGWIAFVLMFARSLLTRDQRSELAAHVLRGVLVALTLVSLVGMPGQDPAIALTFWTMAAAWYLSGTRPAGAHTGSPGAWWAAAAVLVAFASGTIAVAAGPLRPPVRMQRIGGEYRFGFFPPERDDEGEFRWARRRATAVIPAAGPRLRVTVGVNHAAPASYPAHVRVRVNGDVVFDDDLTFDRRTLTRDLTLESAGSPVLIETWTDRVVTAPPPDGRELGLMVRWQFAPPQQP